jgi:hypothetical protein
LFIGYEFFVGWGFGGGRGGGEHQAAGNTVWRNSEFDEEAGDFATPYLDGISVSLRSFRKTIVALAVGTHTSIQHYNNLPLADLLRDLEAYAEYMEERKQQIENARRNRRH